MRPTGPVVSILDGDTIEVLHNQRSERIRFSGIDCPKKGQAYGKRAKQAASELVFGREVTLQTHGKDKYGRTIADVLLPDGSNINQILVKDGWCWWYPKYAPENVILAEVQRRARRSGLGLWADPAPIPPGNGGRGESVSREAYFLALARLVSACVALSGSRIVGLK